MRALSILLVLAISTYFLPVHGSQDYGVTDLLLEGIESQKNGNLAQALDCFNKAAEKDPTNYVAWRNKGLALSALCNYSEAILAFNKSLENNNLSVSTWLGMGYALDELGDTFGAVNAYYQVTQISTNNSTKRDAWMDIGIIREKYFSKHPENSSIGYSVIEAYNRAIGLDPDFEKAHYNKGNFLQKIGDYETAIKSYNDAILINKNHKEAFYNLGNALYLLSRYDEAIAAYSNAIKIDPKYMRAWHNKGVALWKISKNGEAILAISKALEANPSNANNHSIGKTLYAKGLVIADLGRFNESISLFDESIDKDPNLKEAHYAKGLALAKMSRYEDAIKSFDAAIKLDPQYEAAWSQKGVALSVSNRDVEALESFDKALELNYSSFNLYGKGLALYKLGCFEESLLAFNDEREQDNRNANINSLDPTRLNFILSDMVFFITILFNVLCLIILIYKKTNKSVLTFMLLANTSGFITFGCILVTFLHQAVFLKYISVGASIALMTIIFLIIINQDISSIISRMKTLLSLAANNFEKECRYISLLKIAYLFIITCYILISTILYLQPSGRNLIIWSRFGLFSVLMLGLICTLPILYKFIKCSCNDKAALDNLFAIYSGYLGMNALLSYWIIWSFGIIIISPKKILLFNTSLDTYVAIIILSTIVLIFIYPYILSMRKVPGKQNGGKDITSRIWAAFVTSFSLFLGPALSELIIKLGLPISSVDFPALIARSLQVN